MRFEKWEERDVFRERLYRRALLVGTWGMPALETCSTIPQESIPFHAALTASNTEQKWIHFFLDDYQFERLWVRPERYRGILKRCRGVIGPDYSLYYDLPQAQQIYNCFRNRVLGAWMQNEGIPVIPIVRWGNLASHAWCFDGLPACGTVAVSARGSMRDAQSRYYFRAGYEKMMERLTPSAVLFYGEPPPWVDEPNITVLPVYRQKEKRTL